MTSERAHLDLLIMFIPTIVTASIAGSVPFGKTFPTHVAADVRRQRFEISDRRIYTSRPRWFILHSSLQLAALQYYAKSSTALGHRNGP
jgi:hypothetical protein